MLKPAQITLPLAGLAELKAGAVGLEETGQVTIVVGPVPLQP